MDNQPNSYQYNKALLGFALVSDYRYQQWNMGSPLSKQKNYKDHKDSNFFIKSMISSKKVFDIATEYQLVCKIGQGTYAEVFQARSTRSKKPCALKRVDKSKAKGIQILLNNEFSILRELDHPNIIKIYGMEEDTKNYYIISELIKGKQLFEHFKQKKKFEEPQAFCIFHQILLAVNHLHLNKIMHRDVKLENIIYDEKEGVAKLIDFGSAVQMETLDPTTYKCVGTVSYLAPEVIGKLYNHKCDIWSLGVFLYLLLSGSTPFSGKDQQQTFQKIRIEQLNFSGVVWEKISKDAKELIKKMLTKNPKERIQLTGVINSSWVQSMKNSWGCTHDDQEALIGILKRMTAFGRLKLVQIQLGILVFMINFMIQIPNQGQFIRCFHLIDSAGDGVITIEELIQAMIQFMDRPQKTAEKDAKQILNKIDFNNSKDISYSQYLVAASNLSLVLTDEHLERTFKMIDTDNSGKLSSVELREKLGEQSDPNYYSKLIAFFDEDKDGEISLREFKKMMKNLAN